MIPNEPGSGSITCLRKAISPGFEQGRLGRRPSGRRVRRGARGNMTYLIHRDRDAIRKKRSRAERDHSCPGQNEERSYPCCNRCHPMIARDPGRSSLGQFPLTYRHPHFGQARYGAGHSATSQGQVIRYVVFLFRLANNPLLIRDLTMSTTKP